jgi:hypothetical protein
MSESTINDVADEVRQLREEIERLSGEVRHTRDRQEIMDCLTRYGRGVDRHDEDLLRSVYHADAIDQHGTLLLPREEFIPWANAIHEEITVAHMHFLSNNSVEIDGDVAHSEIYVQVVLRGKTGRLRLCGGRYIDRLERRDGEWRVAARGVLVDWACTADGVVWDEIGEFPTGTWDRSDVSYHRPLRVPLPEGGRRLDTPLPEADTG